MQTAPSARLRRLAALVRAPLQGMAVPAGAIDADLAQFAIGRHRVGPLLQIAAQTAGADGDAARMLAKHYRENAFRLAKADILLKEVAALFFKAQLPWLSFKGLPQSRRLYRDPTWRQAHDIDLLVPPAHFARAAAALTGSGFAVGNARLAPEHWTERWIARLAKDVPYHQARSGLSIELHRRLFFAAAVERASPMLRETFRPRPGRDAGDIPVAEPGAGMALYLTLHGAGCRWFRLKWLADLLPLLAGLDEAQKRALADAAENLQAAPAVKAALMLLRAVFGAVALGPLDRWLDEAAGRGAAAARADAYLEALDNPAATEGLRDGKRLDALDMYLSMMGGARYRGEVVLRGGAWILSKALRDNWPG